MSKKRAADYERVLVNRFWESGFAVMRAPSSSGTSKMPRPDVFAGSAERNLLLALEIKTSRQDVFYVQKEQIDGLIEFANRIGGRPYLAVKFVGKRMDFLFLSVPDSLTESKGESYRISIDNLKIKGIDYTTLINP
ncbi:MAG: Holliday junction resolvase [Asgard group archaeon]|nr:Holliday junction resolvase [Asgard group archaeon]